MRYTPEIKKILVPITNRDEGALVLKHAMAFHEIYACEIILLYVIRKKTVVQSLMQEDKQKERIEISERKLEVFALDFFGGKLPEFVSLKVVKGRLIQAILKSAEESKCDLIIIKKRKPVLRKFRFIKNEDELIASSACPVLTIPENKIETSINDILIPVDIRKKVDTKVAWVKYLALKFNAKVHIVSVLDLDIAPNSSLAYQKALSIEESMKKVGLEANVLLLKSKGRNKQDVILSHIEALKPDFVLMMTHQESILFDHYIGEFASEVIQKSTSPIFSLVPRRETLMSQLIEPIISPKKSSDILI
ncbi:universal stress protein [Ancylomarina sp.]|uniref:universal stress protein n=1 Tax=Ancylomarina sp. TaxID=1970196 RepID=UPI0035699BF7